MNRAQLVVGTLSPTPRGCERICERNAAKLPRWAGTRRDGWDGRLAATCTFETRKPLRDVDRLAHNPEVHVRFCGRATGRHVLVSPDIGMGPNLLVAAGRALPEAPR